MTMYFKLCYVYVQRNYYSFYKEYTSAVLFFKLMNNTCLFYFIFWEKTPTLDNTHYDSYFFQRGTQLLLVVLHNVFISQVFYLFEPLYHVQLALLPRLAQSRNLAERRVILGAARDLLRSLYHCHLGSLESYIRPRPANHSTDKLFRRGASKGLMSALCPLVLLSFV